MIRFDERRLEESRELLRIAEELAEAERRKVQANAVGCCCEWERGNRLVLCDRCRTAYPLFAEQWDLKHG